MKKFVVLICLVAMIVSLTGCEKMMTYEQVVNILVQVDNKGEIIGYNWDALHTMMKKDPTQVPPELYAALTDIFDGMAMEDKEQFIVESYLLAVDDYVSISEKDKKYRQVWELSPIYTNLAGLYMLKLYEFDLSEIAYSNTPIHEHIFHSMLLMQVEKNASIIRSISNEFPDRPYVVQKPDVSIEEFYCYGCDEKGNLSEDILAFPRKSWDYKIMISGKNWDSYAFSVLQYREELKPTLNALALNELLNLSLKKESADNMRLKLGKKFDLGNMAGALFWSASMSINTDGSIDTAFSVVKKYDLNIALRAYTAVTGNTTPSAEEIEMMIRAGTIDDSVDGYVKWYNLGSKDNAIRNYTEMLRKAYNENYSGDKKQIDLSSEEIRELEKFFPDGWKEVLILYGGFR